VTVRNDRPPGAPVQLQRRSSFLTAGFSTEHRTARSPGASVLAQNDRASSHLGPLKSEPLDQFCSEVTDANAILR